MPQGACTCPCPPSLQSWLRKHLTVALTMALLPCMGAMGVGQFPAAEDFLQEGVLGYMYPLL